MTRIIGGVAGGRRIAVPPSGTRPTSDRVREALFSALDHDLDWAQTHVADLYAGSGALGLEAASRGAAHVMLVDNSRAAVTIMRSNIEAVGLRAVDVMTADVHSVAASAPAGSMLPRDLVLLDPPYDVATDDVLLVLAALGANNWLAPQALVVIERGVRCDPITWPAGFIPIRERKYGDTVLWFGRFDRS